MANALQSNLTAGQTATVLADTVAGSIKLTGASGSLRQVILTDALSDAGVPLTASATGGAMGISRTAGTSLTLVGEATSSSAKTDKALFVFNLPSTYIAGANFPIAVNASVTGSGTLTGASTTITMNVYTEIVGVETALSVSAAQPIVAGGSTLTFTVTGTGVAAGTQLGAEIVMLVTSSTGANTGVINSVSYTA